MRAIFGFLTMTAGACAQQFVISTYAGGAPPPPLPTVAVNAAIGAPAAVAADSAGNVYFSGSSQNLGLVFKMDRNGVLTRFAGGGTAGYSGDGGPAISAQLSGSFPALAVDGTGNVYIEDHGNGRIRKVSAAGIISTVAGNGSLYAHSSGYGDGGPATNAPLYLQGPLAVDAAGNLYLGEWNLPNVRKVSLDGIISTVAGNGRSGFSGDGGPATSASMGAAKGLAIDDAGNLYISDNIPGDDYSPDGIRIRRVSPDGIINTIAGTGAPGETPDSGDGGPATSAEFQGAAALAVDNAGNLYVSDYGRIRKISAEGIITTFAGNGMSGYSGDGGTAVDASFAYSVYGIGLTTDRAGNLYLADAGNSRIRKVSMSGIITTFAGNGTNDCCYSGDGGTATSAQLYSPVGVVVDAAGNVYIADTYNNRIRRVSPDGILTTVAGGEAKGDTGDGGPAINARLAWPAGLALDSSGNLYFADMLNRRIRMISPAGIITTVVGNPTYCSFPCDGGPATSASLSTPKDVAIDSLGNLYLVDTADCRVRKVSTGGTITTVAGNGRFGYSGDGGPATGAMLNAPSGVAVDSAGAVYIADTNNFRVRKISPSGIISTVAGNGTGGSSGDGGPATSAQLAFPVGLKIDSAGNLYIGDGAAVRMVSAAGTITTVAGNGTAGYTGDGGPATSAQTGAWGLAFDQAGNLYVADPWNNAVRLLKPVGAPVP